jgi:hypothetical protein
MLFIGGAGARAQCRKEQSKKYSRFQHERTLARDTVDRPQRLVRRRICTKHRCTAQNSNGLRLPDDNGMQLGCKSVVNALSTQRRSGKSDPIQSATQPKAALPALHTACIRHVRVIEGRKGNNTVQTDVHPSELHVRGRVWKVN